MFECTIILLLSYLLDRCFGDPFYTFHPMRMIGKSIILLEAMLRQAGFSGIGGGVILVSLTLLFTISCYLGVRFFLSQFLPMAAYGLDIFLVYSCFAAKDLINHIKPIAFSLERKDLKRAKELVSRVVGRDTSTLDTYSIARAAIESLSENFVDGVLSPLIWYVVSGTVAYLLGVDPCGAAVSGMLFFKTVSTLDSMVGYQNNSYEKFGKMAARIDDVLNYMPARISFIFLSLAAMLFRQHLKKGVKIFFRDRLRHPSPNAAHAESFMAGALDLKLGGPSQYGGNTICKPWLGDGSTAAAPYHILLSCKMISVAANISVSFSLLLMISIS